MNKRIFLDRVRPQTSEGTSGFIGLSVCRRIVQVHGGRIWVVSKLARVPAHFTVPVWQDKTKSNNT